MTRANVVFPAPDGPITAVSEPVPAVKETLSRTDRPAMLTVTEFTARTGNAPSAGSTRCESFSDIRVADVACFGSEIVVSADERVD